MTTAVVMPLRMPGRNTDQNARNAAAPRSRAASSRLKSNFSAAAVERQDGEGQIGVNADEQHRAGVEEQGFVFAEQMDGAEEAGEAAFRVEDLVPGEDADEEIRPEGDDDEQQQAAAATWR